MSIPQEVMIGQGVVGKGLAAQSRIDEIIASRFACRDFSGAPVGRGIIEEILRVARFAPSGANIQPWRVYVLAGDAKERVSAALHEAHETARDAHVSEYRYYASDLPEPYLQRRQEFGRLFYGSLGIAQTDAEARSAQTAKNYAFFGAPVGLIVTIDRRLQVGSWLDLGMFVQNVLLAAAGHGLQSCPQETFSKYHRILRPLLQIPAEQMVVCGISIGRARDGSRGRLMPRADIADFAAFAGFEDQCATETERTRPWEAERT
ncbi:MULTISPECIES: nitroreductase [unclassified Bradyrhizobium]|uniref:nitroreductase n=1 Tax=unclassified Bradyrhizobium TaxID=2631580 RepID=UPI0020B4063C|nr:MULTISPECIES: nitroreductase [unclassified Bradyrhizobium]MCP3383168.1 nitroreductase [Bradyrhizobium sp. CCGUVB4N]MCP3444249.1 nitroreductase [Bradyrhizobium sp. CCGUVB14]